MARLLLLLMAVAGLVLGAGGGTRVPTCSADDEGSTGSSVDCRNSGHSVQWRLVEVLFLALLSRDRYLFQPRLCTVRREFVTHVTGKNPRGGHTCSWRAVFCYPGNKAHSRGGKNCYMGGGT